MTRCRRRRRAPGWPVIALIALYLISRIGFYMAGVRFDLSPLASSWQILDPALLRHHLFESLAHMPGQPPLYNLWLGTVLKLSDALGGDEQLTAVLFRLSLSCLSLTSCLLLYGLCRALSIHRGLAFAVTAVFMCSPALALYESLPYYSVPVLCLLMAIAWSFHACLTAFTPLKASLFCLLMAVLIATRSMFQIEWMAVLLAYAAWVLPGHRRTLLLAAVLPLVFVLALYAKNVVLVGQFSTSDWMGMSLAKLTTLQLTPEERQRLVAAGRMSPMALDDKAFDIPEAYEAHLGGAPHTGHAVLDDKRKSTGRVNFNYLHYGTIADMAAADARVAIQTHPTVYLRSMGRAWLMFFRPASDYPFLKHNRDALGLWSRGYAYLVAGQPVYPDQPAFALRPATVGIFIMLGYVIAAAFGVYLIGRALRRRRLSPADATLIFLWLNIMYVGVVGNALEIDENQRFRFAINPMISLLLVVAVQRLHRHWRAARRTG